ncbi:MAG: hypothetical protein LBU90_03670 [Bacteroidales bacterium]|jgi:hypothetical protein|nr:hypothetical protein [Bacteroidales bacterium]
MKVIYSFNSYGGKNIPCAWWLRMAELSVQSMKNCGYRVELYTDTYCADVFRGSNFCVSFDVVHVVDFMQFPHNMAYWNFGKLYVYSLQSEAFLHVDFDTYFHTEFRIPESGHIITEQERDYTYVQAFKDCAILPKTDTIPAKLICSGLLGSTGAYFVWKEVFDFARTYCQKAPRNTETMGYLVGVEEFNLSQIVQFYGLEVTELKPASFLHWQGANKRAQYDKYISKLYYETFKKSMYYNK